MGADDVVTREYTINLGKATHGVTFKKRAPRAVKAVRIVRTRFPMFFLSKCAPVFGPKALSFCVSPSFLGGGKETKWGLEIATRDGSREIRDAKCAVEMRAACIYILACAGFSLVARFAFVFFTSSQDRARERQKFSDDPKKGGDEAAFFHFFFSTALLRLSKTSILTLSLVSLLPQL